MPDSAKPAPVPLRGHEAGVPTTTQKTLICLHPSTSPLGLCVLHWSSAYHVSLTRICKVGWSLGMTRGNGKDGILLVPPLELLWEHSMPAL